MSKLFGSSRVAWTALALAACLSACSTSVAQEASRASGTDASLSSIVLSKPADLGFDAEKLDKIRSGLSADVESGKIAGAYMIVGRHGKVALAEGFGLQGPGQTAPMSQETIFRIFSMTKTVVAVIAMTLVEEGKLKLDDPVSKFIPGFAEVKVYRPDGAITPAKTPLLVRHLLSHTSGIIYGAAMPAHPVGKLYAEFGENRTDLTPLEYAVFMARLPLIAEPGTAWNYSQSITVLGGVIEAATGQPLDEVIRTRGTGPLGMTDTGFYQSPSKQARFAQPKQLDPGYPDYTAITAMKSGGGGLSSTPEDFLRFTLMLAGNGTYRGVQILKPESVANIREDQTTQTTRNNGVFFPGRGLGFGLGFSVAIDDSVQRTGVGTISWNGVAGTEFWVDPKNDAFMVFMVQDRALRGEYQLRNRNWIYDALVPGK